MLIISSHGGVPIRLTDERWSHITARHPEMRELRGRVLETLSEPDMTQEGNFGELLAVREYPDLAIGRFVVVVYREAGPKDGFVLTAYVAGRISSRRNVLWKR